MTLTVAMELLGCQMAAENLADSTIDAYRSDVRIFVSYLKSIRARDSIAHFTRENVQSWLIEQTAKGFGPQTRNRRLAALSRLAEFLIGIDRLEKNPMTGIRRAKEPKTVVQYLPPDDVTRLIGAAGPTVVSRFGSDRLPHSIHVYEHRNEAILRTFVQLGPRRGEVWKLNLGNLQHAGVLLNGKGGKQRFIMLSSTGSASIQAWLAERRGGTTLEDPLFTNHAGGRLSEKQLWRIVSDAADRAGIAHTHPHLLRHTNGSLLRARGIDLDVNRDRLGHASVSTTEGYVHAVPLGQEEVTETLADL